MKIPSFIRRVRSRWKDFGRRMQSPSVVSNGTKVREGETEVLACSREIALCLPIDLEAAFRFRLRKRASRKVGGEASGWLETTWPYSRVIVQVTVRKPGQRANERPETIQRKMSAARETGDGKTSIAAPQKGQNEPHQHAKGARETCG
jgi:hypothetical protein